VSAQARVVVSALCVFNGSLLVIVGVMSLVFVDGDVRFVVSAAVWLFAFSLFVLAHYLRKGVEWR
jgi:hypothetical protein